MARSSPLPIALALGSLVSLMATLGLLVYHRIHGSAADDDEPVLLTSAAVARCNADLYQEQLNHDAAGYGVTAPDKQTMADPLAGGVELSAPRLLQPGSTDVGADPEPGKEKPRGKAKAAGKAKGKRGRAHARPAVATPGGGIKTEHLLLKLEVERLPKGGEMADHLVLSITNQTKVPVAYRVLTDPPAGVSCEGMFTLPYNALVLLPEESIRRVECLAPAHPQLRVRRVEAYELTELGGRYLRRLPMVSSAIFDARVSEAHRGEPLPLCSREFVAALDSYGAEGFPALVNFYARHNCMNFHLPRGYKPDAMPPPVCQGAKVSDEDITAAKSRASAAAVARQRGPGWPVYGGGGLSVLLLLGAVATWPRRKVRKQHKNLAVVQMKQDEQDINDAYFR